MTHLSNVMLQMAALDPLTKVYSEFLSTGIVGAVAILFLTLWRQSVRKKEQRQTEYEAVYQSMVADKDKQAEACRSLIQVQSREFHDELKELTQQLMGLLKEKSVSETKVTEVLQQVVSVQRDVDRTLSVFLARADGAHSGIPPRR